jgi:hypothetical protein
MMVSNLESGLAQTSECRDHEESELGMLAQLFWIEMHASK